MVKINPLFFAAVAIVWYFGHIYEFGVMFLTLIIHELIHFLFMLKNKAAISIIKVEPFGISITAKHENPATPWIYLSAPIFNLMLGAIIFMLTEKNYYVNYFMLSNLTLGAFNLIPVIPFDGGRALAVILLKKHDKTAKIQYKIGILTSVILIICGCYLVYITKFNFSVVIIGIFLLYNSITEKALLTEKVIKHYSSLEKRGTPQETLPIVSLAVPKDYPAHKLIKKFNPESYCIIKVIENGTVIKTLTETQIIRKLITENHRICAYEV